MPRKNGEHLYRQIRAALMTSDIPVFPVASAQDIDHLKRSDPEGEKYLHSRSIRRNSCGPFHSISAGNAWVNHPEKLLTFQLPPGMGVQFLDFVLHEVRSLREVVKNESLTPPGHGGISACNHKTITVHSI